MGTAICSVMATPAEMYQRKRQAGAPPLQPFDPAGLPEGKVKSMLQEQLMSGERPKPPWQKGVKLSTRLDIVFFLFMLVCLYFALLVEYDLDMLDLIRTPPPGRSQNRMTRYARRMELKDAKQAARANPLGRQPPGTLPATSGAVSPDQPKNNPPPANTNQYKSVQAQQQKVPSDGVPQQNKADGDVAHQQSAENKDDT